MDHFGPFWPEEAHFGPLRSQFRVCRGGVAATPLYKGPVAPHPGPPPPVGCRGWFGPPKPCRTPGDGAAALASVALHFDTKFAIVPLEDRNLLK